MAVKIADANSNASLQGSPDKHIDVAPDGTLWMMYMYQGGSDGTIKFFYSRDGGATWNFASKGDLSVGQTYATPSFFIDAQGYAHMCWSLWNRDPQVIRYAYGTPSNINAPDGRILFRGWTWRTVDIAPASGRVQIDTDVIAYRVGNGVTNAFVAYTLDSSGGCQIAQVRTVLGYSMVISTTIGPSSGLGLLQMGSLDFAHTGDGKTPAASPDLYLATGLKTTSGSVRVAKASYSAGTYTWGSPVVAGTATLDESCLCSVFDGTRFMTAWAGTSGAISVAEWSGSGATTARNPPAMPGGVGKVLGLSLSCDPINNDLYLAFYDVTDGDIRWSRFTRASTTWSAWAIAVTRTATNYDGKVNLVRHPPLDSVDMVYGVGSASTWSIYSQQLAPLVRIPAAPILLTPGAGEQRDLAAGATFTWDYTPVSPGDAQAAWAFTRTASAVTQWWNASAQSWGSTIVWNSGSDEFASFPAGAWTTATTYTWSVRGRSLAGQDSPAASSRTVVATSAPVVDVTGPSGIAYGDSTPLVTWDYTSLYAQRDYQVRIIAEQSGIDPNSTTSVWDSGVVSSSSARTARISTPLTDGVSYRAYVRSTSTATVQSSWSFEPFTLSVTPASGPAVVASVVPSYGPTGVPRVLLTLAGQASLLTEAQNDGSDGWENDSNATVVQQVLDTTNQLSQGMKMTSVAAGAMRMRTEVGDPPTGAVGEPAPTRPVSFPVVAGSGYTAVASLKAAVTTRSARVLIRWYDNDDGTGTLLSTSTGSSVSITSVAYAQVVVSATAPVGAVLGRLVVEVLATAAASEVFYVTQPSFAPGAGTAWQPGGYSATQTLRVERSDDAGVTWTTVIARSKPDTYQKSLEYDRSMPFGIAVQYRAYSDVDQGGGATSASQPSTVSTVTIVADRWGLRDLGDDVGEMYGYVVGHRRSDDESSAVHRPAGREDPIVDTEGLHLATGTLSIFVKQADIDAAITVLRRTATMTVQSPSGMLFRARFLSRDYNIEQLRHRIIDVPYIQVA